MVVLLMVGVMCARADVSLLVQEPFGNFGAMNPTGHAAVYLDHVCAASPTQLRTCETGEMGSVISRYHRAGGYDWLAVPILPYLYAVESLADVPATATPAVEADLRERYRLSHLQEIAPDLPDGGAPRGEWIQMIGASYDRTIYGFTVQTTAGQDERLIAHFNDRHNVSQFNLFFNNCADLSRDILDLYYPHAVRRSFLADFGFTTPKHIAKMLTRYGKKHDEAGLTTFVIPQVAGTIERSTHIRGVAESLIKTKKYLIPLVVFHPEFTGGLAVAYLTRGRYSMPTDAVPLSAENFAVRDAGTESKEQGQLAASGTTTDASGPDGSVSLPVESSNAIIERGPPAPGSQATAAAPLGASTGGSQVEERR